MSLGQWIILIGGIICVIVMSVATNGVFLTWFVAAALILGGIIGVILSALDLI